MCYMRVYKNNLKKFYVTKHKHSIFKPLCMRGDFFMKNFISILVISYILFESNLSCSHTPPSNNESLAQAQALVDSTPHHTDTSHHHHKK